MDELLKMQSEICKTFANPFRLSIIKMLCKGEMNASKIIKKIGISKANLSQHMALLKEKGIVESFKRGRNVYYKITDARIGKACNLMSEVTIDNLRRKRDILNKIERAF
ncbi:MAG: metalloregulator ArsR/SmtB family transcription factor [Candidatus Goldbacteria bacterium]|nr:metalloregulator ArsR/SmtB family transcription factor [Candidatus Goldiibacteriota bacterium]